MKMSLRKLQKPCSRRDDASLLRTVLVKGVLAKTRSVLLASPFAGACDVDALPKPSASPSRDVRAPPAFGRPAATLIPDLPRRDKVPPAHVVLKSPTGEARRRPRGRSLRRRMVAAGLPAKTLPAVLTECTPPVGYDVKDRPEPLSSVADVLWGARKENAAPPLSQPDLTRCSVVQPGESRAAADCVLEFLVDRDTAHWLRWSAFLLSCAVLLASIFF